MMKNTSVPDESRLPNPISQPEPRPTAAPHEHNPEVNETSNQRHHSFLTMSNNAQESMDHPGLTSKVAVNLGERGIARRNFTQQERSRI